ncbi:aminotransferase class I/II-fold pyridoxal phosphate-dependent enzyme [Actinospica robiniae]|uniref:aminotransferase class I/II-fold pyridoxal phosphate-dependent enzyme n=1 Tax=Actinospica robiniae TaxID=304901 RepID=UPI0005515A55|nr:aminotransferase class I/II-fold pyridoxal phosphate-dependent enzyme [Actinospica robiniae]
MSEQSAWWERYKLAGSGASEIVFGVETAVTAGLLAPGESLPPVRELAGHLHVNPNTVASAYRTLRDRGTVETRGRAGTRVRERPGTSNRMRSYELPEGVRDLTSGEPAPRLLPRLKPPASIDVSGYRYAPVEPDLEEQLRRRVGRLFEGAGTDDTGGAAAGVGADAAESAESAELLGTSRMLAVFGSLDGIERLLATHTRPGDKIAVEDPAWGNMLDLAAARGLTVVPMRMDDEGPDPTDLRAALGAGVNAVVVTTRAQNPYGAVVSARRASALRTVLATHPEVLTIDDDHGADLTSGVPHLLCGATRQWAYLYSASKAYGPDMRIAALIGDADTTDRVAGQLRHSSRRVPGVMQLLWAQALADRGNDAVLAEAASVYAENRKTLISELAARGVAAHGESGLSVWIPVPDETAAATGLLARGWAVAPGSWYRVRSGPGIRVTVATMHLEEMAALAEAVASTLNRGKGVRPDARAAESV